MAPDSLLDSSDAELAAGVRAGDEACFRVLYARHGPQLYRVVIRVLGGDSAEADDVVQETWLRALGALAAFRWESAFSSWLIGIGINQARDALRRRSRRGAGDSTRTDRLRARVAPIGERIDLERAVAMLPARRRTVLVLHDIEGYAHEEIGAMLGITVGTSKSQLFHARRSLRALLEPGRRGGPGRHGCGADATTASNAAHGPARTVVRPRTATAAGGGRIAFGESYTTQPTGLPA